MDKHVSNTPCTDANDVKPEKKTFWNSMRPSTKFLLLMLGSSILSGFLKPNGLIFPEYITLPHALCQFLWAVGSLGWFYQLYKEISLSN